MENQKNFKNSPSQRKNSKHQLKAPSLRLLLLPCHRKVRRFQRLQSRQSKMRQPTLTNMTRMVKQLSLLKFCLRTPLLPLSTQMPRDKDLRST